MLILVVTLLLTFRILYLRYYHPLHSIPGPFLAAVSRIPYATAYLQGRRHTQTLTLHRQYGPVVRIAPDEVSFVSEAAWTDIYGHGRSFSKDARFFNVSKTGHAHLATCADNDIHSRQRRAIARGFSESALRDQEPTLRAYVDLLIERLSGHCTENPEQTVDLTRWYNYTTFDFTAKYVLGESLSCLEGADYHPWVRLIFDALRASAAISTAKYFPFIFSPLIKLATAFVYRGLLRSRKDNFHITVAKLEKRLARTELANPDFITYLRKGTSDKAFLSPEELRANANFLLIAGSETTATQLSAATFFLLSHLDVYKELVRQVRARFSRSEDICFASLVGFPYLRAVLQEALRLHPSTPLGMPRVVPAEGAMICNRFITGGTAVSVPHYAANRSPEHFTKSDQFLPERWLEEKPEEFQNDRVDVMQPFSVGPRNCLGKKLAQEEGSLILAKMLWHFDLQLDEGCHQWTQQRAFLVWETNPLLVRLSLAQH